MIAFIEGNTEFMLGIYSGLAASFILYIFSKLLKYVKKFFLGKSYINVLTKSKIQYVYDNQEQIKKHLYEDALRSKKMYVFTFFEGLFADVTGDFHGMLKTKDGDIKIMYTDPNSKYTIARTKEVNTVISIETINGHHQSIKELQKVNNNIQLVTHDEFLRFKFFIFDDVMYLGFRLKDIMSDHAQIYKIGRDSYLYKAYLEQFQNYWEKYSK